MSMEEETTMVKLPKKIVEEIKELRITPNEPHYNVITRLLEHFKKDRR